MPYDSTADVRNHAWCDQEPIGLRPVRRTVGEQVFRATDVCIDSERDMPDDFRQKLIGTGYDLFVRSPAYGPLARRTSAGDLMGIGPARFAMDEQWWLSEPARQPGQRVWFRPSDMPIELEWTGEESPYTSACRSMAEDDPSTEGAWNRIVRRHGFILNRQSIWLLGRFGTAEACAHLDCTRRDIDPDECAADCPGWVLPWAIAFSPAEPGSEAQFCR